MASITTQDTVPATPQDSTDGEPPLLDLSFLTEEEREKIGSVMQADQELRTRDRIRLGTLRQSIQQERTHQREVASTPPPRCSCCERRFGRVFNTGANCPQCSYRVCKRCRQVPYVRPPSFFCDVCAKQKLLELQSKDYNVPPPSSQTVTPRSSRNNSPVPVRSATNQNEEEVPPSLYGSELVIKSLQAVGQNSRSSSPIPVPLQPTIAHPTVASPSSVASSIVVRYERHSSTEGSPSPAPPPCDSLKLTEARHVLANELLDSDDDDNEAEKRSEQQKQSVVSTPAMDYLKRSDSMGSLGSMTSMYSAAGGKGDYDITGEVKIAVWFKDGQLFVKVVKARGLAAAKKGLTSDPYVKTYLLPDKTKQTKRKTAIQRKTLNPVFNEILKNKLDRSEIGAHALWLSVWDWDRFGHNQFLGEVRLLLSTLDLADPTERWLTLLDKEDGGGDDDFYRGRLRLSLKVEPSIDHKGHTRKGVASFLIKIHQAQELPKMNPLGLTDATVKCYLLPNRNSGGKRKTKVVKNNLNPFWEEEFKYDFLTVSELSTERVLEVTVWDFDRRGSNDFIGGLRLGPAPGRAAKHKEWMDSIGEEVTHWEAALARPGEWVELWHTLRPTMHPMTKRISPSALRKTGLSPVKESPTREWEVEQSTTPAVVEGVAFTPPITPQHGPSILSQPRDATPIKLDQIVQENVTTSRTPSPPPPQIVTPSRDTSRDITPPITVSKMNESQVFSEESTPIPEVLAKSNLKREDYHSSQTSLYSAAGVKGDYDITGEVLFGVQYKAGQLLIHVKKARGLAAADGNGLSDPYVKTYLLPDKSKTSKKKTAIKKKTLNPVYNETLKCKLDSSEIEKHTLWMSVWDWDRFGHNQFLGEVRLPLSTLNLTDPTEHWYTLLDRSDSPLTLHLPVEPSTSSQHLVSEPEAPQTDRLHNQPEALQTDRLHSEPEAPQTDRLHSEPEQPPQTDHLHNQPEAPQTDILHSEPEATQTDILHSEPEQPPQTDSLPSQPEQPPQTDILHSEPEQPPQTDSLHSEPEQPPQTDHLHSEPEQPPQTDILHSDPPGPPIVPVTPLISIGEAGALEGQLEYKEEDHEHQHRSGLKSAASVSSFGSQTSLYSAAGVKGDYDITGEVLFGVQYKAGQLLIHVNKARGLAAADGNGLSDPYVKTYLLPDKSKTSKKKTAIKKKTLNPVYNETLKYKLNSSEIEKHTLWMSVWDWDRFGHNQFLGEVRLPLSTLNLTDPTEHWYTLQDKDESHSVDLTLHEKPSIPSPPPGHEFQSTIEAPQKETPRDEPPTPATSDTLPLTSLDSVTVTQSEEPHSDPPGSPLVPEEPHSEPPGSPLVPEEPHSEPVATPLINIGNLETAELEEHEVHLKPKPIGSFHRGGLLGLKQSDSMTSFGSMASVYSAAGGKGDYDITGEVLFGVQYKAGQLLIHVNKARGLAAADGNGLSDPYVKTYLLPDKSKTSKKKTAIKKKTLNPVYNETLKYKLSSSEIEKHTLWMSVWDWDRFGSNQFLGEVRLPLSTLNLTDPTEHWYALQDKDEGGEGASYHGQLQLSLMFSPSEKQSKSKKTKGTLNIAVRQAKDLPQMNSSGTTDAFLKFYLLPDKSNSGKRKTGVVKNNLSPVWGTTFTYEKVSLEELVSERVLEVGVWDFNRGASSDFIGGLRLGSAPGRAAKHHQWMDSIGEEVTHWEAALARPGEWVELWHTLRTSMDYRNVSLT